MQICNNVSVRTLKEMGAHESFSQKSLHEATDANVGASRRLLSVLKDNDGRNKLNHLSERSLEARYLSCRHRLP